MSGQTIETNKLEVTELTNALKATYLGRRVCQLFCFAPLFLISIAVFSFILDLSSWGSRGLTAVSKNRPCRL